MAEVNLLQHFWQPVLGLVFSCVLAGTAVANPSGEKTSGANLTMQECARRVDLALRPMFSPLITQWVQEQYGHEASARIRFIALEPNGVVHLHVDAMAPGRTCVFALFYQWKNGWMLAQADNHSGSASSCH